MNNKTLKKLITFLLVGVMVILETPISYAAEFGVPTGDESNAAVWVLLLLVALVGAAVVVIKRKNASKEEAEEVQNASETTTQTNVSMNDYTPEEQSLSKEEIDARIKELERQIEEVRKDS